MSDMCLYVSRPRPHMAVYCVWGSFEYKSKLGTALWKCKAYCAFSVAIRHMFHSWPLWWDWGRWKVILRREQRGDKSFLTVRVWPWTVITQCLYFWDLLGKDLWSCLSQALCRNSSVAWHHKTCIQTRQYTNLAYLERYVITYVFTDACDNVLYLYSYRDHASLGVCLFLDTIRSRSSCRNCSQRSHWTCHLASPWVMKFPCMVLLCPPKISLFATGTSFESLQMTLK